MNLGAVEVEEELVRLLALVYPTWNQFDATGSRQGEGRAPTSPLQAFTDKVAGVIYLVKN